MAAAQEIGIRIGLHRTAALEAATVERDFAQPPRLNRRAEVVPRAVAAVLTEGFTGVASIEHPTGHAAEVALRLFPWSGAPATVTAIVPTVTTTGAT